MTRGMDRENTMEHISAYEPPTGGRISTPKFRASLQRSEEFEGLQQNIDKFRALSLIKKVGKQGGFTAELVELLEYYLIRTHDIDWTEGHKPICYQCVLTTAHDLDITERQVRNREKALNVLGALTWEDSGNFKRYGVRDSESGEILYAYGVDLSPLASLIPVLEQQLEKKKAFNNLWKDYKRKISGLRGRIRSLLAEACDHPELSETVNVMGNAYNDISYSMRSYHTIDDLKALFERHQLVCQALLEELEGVSGVEDKYQITQDTSSTGVVDCPHIQCTTLKKSDKSDYSSRTGNCLREGVAASSEKNERQPEGREGGKSEYYKDLSNISWKQVLNACSERFKSNIPMHGRPLEWEDLFDAAHTLLPGLGIHKSAWGNACQTLGRHGATICLMIIDQKMHDLKNPILNPGGYLREMTTRAKAGKLNLQGSVFGLLKRGEKNHDA